MHESELLLLKIVLEQLVQVVVAAAIVIQAALREAQIQNLSKQAADFVINSVMEGLFVKTCYQHFP